MYKIRIRNLSGTEIFDIPYLGFSISESLNRGKQGTINCSYQALKEYAESLKSTFNGMLKSVFREVEIYRDGTKIYTMVLNRKQNRKSGVVTLYISDYLAMLGTRITGNDGLKYTATDSAEIAWDEVALSQAKTNGSFGITLGTQPTTKDRQRTLRFDSLLKLIYGMSNDKVSDGYDVEINASKQMNFFYPTKGSVKDNILFTSRNIIDWDLSEGMAGHVVNKVAVLGKGGSESMRTVEVDDTTNQAKWLLHEATVSEKGVDNNFELTDRGNRYLSDNDTPEDNVKLSITHVDGTPNLTDYELGDSVPVKIDEEGIDDNLRIISRSIKLDKTILKIKLGFE